MIRCQECIQHSLGVTASNLSKLKVFKDFKRPKTQFDYYNENNASPEILKFVDIQGKTFGEKYMEKVAREFFDLDKRISSGHDHILNGSTIEQKSARYHANGDDWKWQHIEIKHEWNFLLLTGLDFNSINFYIASRKTVEDLIQLNIISGQGKKNSKGIAEAQQAYWFSRSDFKKKNLIFTDYFLPMYSKSDIESFIAQTTHA